MNLTKRIFSFMIFFGSIVLCLGITFKDKQQNMILENLTNWRMTKINEQTFKFQGTGHPIKGSWKDQHLILLANSIEGLIQSGKNQEFELIDALLKGNVLLDLTSFPKSKPHITRTTHIESQEIEYHGKSSQIILPKPFKATSTYPEELQSIFISGQKAVFNLVPASLIYENSLKSGSITGPVQMKIQMLSQSLSKKETITKTFINATTDHLEISNEGLLMTMTGHVHIEGEQGAFFGDIQADKATIHLNQKREIIDVELEGHPGQTILHKKE